MYVSWSNKYYSFVLDTKDGIIQVLKDKDYKQLLKNGVEFIDGSTYRGLGLDKYILNWGDKTLRPLFYMDAYVSSNKMSKFIIKLGYKDINSFDWVQSKYTYNLDPNDFYFDKSSRIFYVSLFYDIDDLYLPLFINLMFRPCRINGYLDYAVCVIPYSVCCYMLKLWYERDINMLVKILSPICGDIHIEQYEFFDIYGNFIQ